MVTRPVHWKQQKSLGHWNRIESPKSNWKMLIQEGRLPRIASHCWNPTVQLFSNVVCRRVKWAQILAGQKYEDCKQEYFCTFLEAVSSAASPGPRESVSTYESARVLITVTSHVQSFMYTNYYSYYHYYEHLHNAHLSQNVSNVHIDGIK